MESHATDEERQELVALLKSKLAGVPPHHLPALSLGDIIAPSHRVLSLPNIPSDLQLSFFLRNRALIDRYNSTPIKDEDTQCLDITRAIFFYRLDSAHQFARYHDASRWNIAIFTALLCLHYGPSSSPHTFVSSHYHSDQHRQKPLPAADKLRLRDVAIPQAAIRFMTDYLAAVLEHHNTPTVFTLREAFIKRWKNGVQELFTRFGAGQKKVLKNEMKRLTAEWTAELDKKIKELGKHEYQRRVAFLVGTIMPGRKDQGLVPAVAAQGSAENEDIKISHGLNDDGSGIGGGKNELLQALREPIGGGTAVIGKSVTDVCTVSDLRYAIAAVQNSKATDLLPVLLQLFSPKP